MARQTRAQRRARREQMAPGSEAALPGGPPTAPPRRPTARAGRPEPAREPRARRGSGVTGFIAESWAELKKVDWPGQAQVIQATVVVLIACIVVGIYLYANVALWKPVVQRIIGQ
jgi:preprotein translocase subunit SecE